LRCAYRAFNRVAKLARQLPMTNVSPARPILYSFRRCPFAMRARMALIIAGVAVEHREIMLRDKPAAMLAASPKATVPVLVLADGTVIDESVDIMRWALAINDPLGWRAGDDADLIAINDGPFKHHLDRMKYHHRYDGADPAQHRAAANARLATLEARLGGAPYLFGDTQTLTDIALFPFIRQFARVDPVAWRDTPAPRLQSWLNGLIAMPLFVDAMAKHPVWTPPADDGKEQHDDPR
jgi:glutathione S-transferase